MTHIWTRGDSRYLLAVAGGVSLFLLVTSLLAIFSFRTLFGGFVDLLTNWPKKSSASSGTI